MSPRLLGPIVGLALVGCAMGATAPPAAGPSGTSSKVSGAAATVAVPTPPSNGTPIETPALAEVRFSRAGWKTDFSRHTVPLSEIQPGGPPRDGIPPIDHPTFIAPAEAAAWLKDNEPVVVYAEHGDARAYPLQVLIWHEIVNDTVGRRPVAVTFCPLCNTAYVFDRRLGDIVYDFGTTGNLRNSDLVMWDRQTESWWQQITGEAIVGQLAGARLAELPASITSFAEFRATFQNGTVLSRETGHHRAYGRNPYTGYDDVNSSPFLFTGKPDGRLRPMERVVTVVLNGEAVAYPFAHLEPRGVVHDTVGGTPIVVLYRKGTTSALDAASIAASRDIGAAGVFEPAVDGRPLTFRAESGRLLDVEMGSEWNTLGQATSGQLAGRQLRPIVHANHFWFAMAAFYPGVRLWQPG